MVDEAERTTEAAQQTVAVSRETAQTQLRAYVGPDGPLMLQLGDDGTASINISMRNSGQTPARQFRMLTSINVLDHPQHGEIISVAHPDVEFSRKSISPQGSAASSNSLDVSPDEQAAIALGKKAIYVYGWGRYVDIFGTDQITKFRFVYKGPWEGAPSLAVCPEGNDET
jgi:hypothetical protein